MAQQTVTLIKICGLTRPEDAHFAERVGASFLGVILASGPRLLDVDRARDVLGPRRHGVRRVAVFGKQSVEELLRVGDALDLDALQLHGDPSAADVHRLRRLTTRAIWPVLRVHATSLPDGSTELAAAAGTLVLDAHVVGQLGGTGVVLDWTSLADSVAALRVVVPDLQLVLAGGLRSVNVAEAIALLDPDVVDVSSGVETAPGVKDPLAIERFVSAVVAARGTRR